MTQKQTNSLNMFLAVLKFLDDNNAGWNNSSIISNEVQDFRNTLQSIQEAAVGQQSADRIGYTKKKDQDLEKLVDLAYKLALRVKNYAVKINDPVLMQAVDFSKTGLLAGTEKEAVNRCLNIAAKAATVAGTASPDYKITPELITQVTDTAALITPETAERDVQHGMHANATSGLTALVSTAHTQLKQLDDLIEADADEDSTDFVRKYFIMRRTFDHKDGGKKVVAAKNESAVTVKV
jgi:hypothetical protein